MRLKRSRMSARSEVRARIAIISLATVMSKPVSRVKPFSLGPCPMVMPRNMRSLISTTRRQVTLSGSISKRTKLEISSSVNLLGSVLLIPSFFKRRSIDGEKLRLPSFSEGQSRLNKNLSLRRDSWNMRVSIAAASRLLDAVIAWISPVRCRLKSSMGITWL